jgi:hypothetical protein
MKSKLSKSVVTVLISVMFISQNTYSAGQTRSNTQNLSFDHLDAITLCAEDLNNDRRIMLKDNELTTKSVRDCLKEGGSPGIVDSNSRTSLIIKPMKWLFKSIASVIIPEACAAALGEQGYWDGHATAPVPKSVLDAAGSTGIDKKKYTDTYQCVDFANALEIAMTDMGYHGTCTIIRKKDGSGAHAVTDIHAGELTYWIEPQSGKEIGLDYDGDGKVSEDEGNYTVKVYENCKEAGEEEGWSKKLMDRL